MDADDGSVAAHYEYDAFGKTVTAEGVYVEGNPFRFSTKYFDVETGFYYYGLRYYDADIGRWGRIDPLGEIGFSLCCFDMHNEESYPINSLNRYAYLSNNPTNTMDLLGLHPIYPCTCFPGKEEECKSYCESKGKVVFSCLIYYMGFGLNFFDCICKYKPLPENPDDLLDQGYIETSNPNARERGHRTFEHPETGDKIRFDKGRPGSPGHEGRDHFHRYNPDATGRSDQYLDKNEESTRRGSNASHLYPGD